MLPLRSTLVIALIATGLPLAAAAPLDAYGRLPTIEDIQISPDGSLFAVTMTDGDNRIVVVRRPTDKTPIGGLRAGDQKLRSLQWVDSRHLVTTMSMTRDHVMGLTGGKREYWMALAYDVVDHWQMRLLEHQTESLNVIVDAPIPRVIDGVPMVYLQGVHFVSNRGRTALYRVDLQSRMTRMVDAGFEDTRDWVVGADGTSLAEAEYSQTRGEWTLKTRAPHTRWRTRASETAPIEVPSLLGLGRTGKTILVGRESSLGELRLTEYDPEASEQTPDPETAGFASALFDPATHALIGGYERDGDELRYAFYDARNQSAWDAIIRAFAGEQVELVSWTTDRRKVVVLVDGGAKPPAYSLVDLDSHHAEWLGDVYSGIGDDDVAEMRPISYTSRDGLTITGYLTLPRGRDAHHLPLVVFPHGGPAARDQLHFDWWAQAMASRGYAVLQPNFRGSDGLGRGFREAGYGEWGRKMQTDLSDGVRDLAAKNIIDPERVCIVGASYGGYAALAGATLDPGVYRCAVSVAGVSDLKKHRQEVREKYVTNDNAGLRYYDRFLGTDGIRDPELAALSPAQQAEKANIPILLVHGKDDTVVMYDQSTIMADALRKAGKPVELVTLPGEDHWLSRGATRLQMLQAVVAFLEKNVPPH